MVSDEFLSPCDKRPAHAQFGNSPGEQSGDHHGISDRLAAHSHLLIEQWRVQYNTLQPRRSLGYQSLAPDFIVSRTPVSAGQPGPAGSAPAVGIMLNREFTRITRWAGHPSVRREVSF